MENPAARPLSTSESEQIWTDGQDAVQSATGQEPGTSTTLNDAVGIDLPGVGVYRPEGSPVCAGREGAGDVEVRDHSQDLAVGAIPGQMSAERVRASVTLAEAVIESVAEQRERLFVQLAFAAKNLADAQIEPALGPDPAFCVECIVDEHEGVIVHEPTCRTGRVMRVVAELVATVEPGAKKTAAPDGFQIGQVRPDVAPACARCGSRSGKGWALFTQTSHPLQTPLQSNQCEVRHCGWSYRYEHQCESIAIAAEGGAR